MPSVLMYANTRSSSLGWLRSIRTTVWLTRPERASSLHQWCGVPRAKPAVSLPAIAHKSPPHHLPQARRSRPANNNGPENSLRAIFHSQKIRGDLLATQLRRGLRLDIEDTGIGVSRKLGHHRGVNVVG